MNAASLLLLLALGAASRAAQPPPSRALERARSERLWEDPAWRLLVRYRRRPFGGWSGETPEPSFYLAADGRRDPRAELEAAIAAWSEPEPAEGPDHRPECRFPARYGWLRGALEGETIPPPPSCPAFERWRTSLDPGSATLVFADAFLNSPASMYGHTFLRFDRRGERQTRRLLDYTLNFAAYEADKNPVLYAYRGVVGGYKGRFSVLPYYVKVQEYTNLDSRHLWEYRLELLPESLDRLLAHAWELGSAWFPYLFFTRNCSYQLLPLLEAAQPGSALAAWRRPGAVPADTVRRVRERGLLRREPVLRPSRLSILRAGRERLTPAERRLAYRMAEGDVDAALAESGRLSAEREALALDAAADLLLYKVGPDPDPGEAVTAREARLLSRRGKLDARPEPVPLPADAAPPHAGHRSARVSFGAGAARDSTFEELGIRIALHDHLDRPVSYAEGSMLEMFHARIRYDDDARRAYLQSMTAIDIFSLSPWDPWVREQSWRVRTGLETADELGGAPWHSLYYGLRLGRGLAARAPLGRGTLLYAFLEADAGVGEAFRDWYRLGAGGSAGLRAELAPRWRAWLEARYIGVPLGDARDVYGLSLGQQLDLGPDAGLRLILDRRRERREALLSLNLHL
ncbi:MAG: DUF4105 domain-containing protein [Elusimicrobia bacterium]|nr:DUF4105 domain-containing protein [Elusimicrobiota bacterium]